MSDTGLLQVIADDAGHVVAALVTRSGENGAENRLVSSGPGHVLHEVEVPLALVEQPPEMDDWQAAVSEYLPNGVRFI